MSVVSSVAFSTPFSWEASSLHLPDRPKSAARSHQWQHAKSCTVQNGQKKGEPSSSLLGGPFTANQVYNAVGLRGSQTEA